MHTLRYAGTLLANLLRFGARSGRWWVPTIIVLLAVASVLVIAIKVVVPATVYTLL
jgi:hypothetical protein